MREDQGYPRLETVFDTEVLREEITAWADQLDGPVRLGWAPDSLVSNAIGSVTSSTT